VLAGSSVRPFPATLAAPVKRSRAAVFRSTRTPLDVPSAPICVPV
jgi:hypothetical protein